MDFNIKSSLKKYLKMSISIVAVVDWEIYNSEPFQFNYYNPKYSCSQFIYLFNIHNFWVENYSVTLWKNETN